MAALERYHPKYNMDNQGRVVQLWLDGPEVEAQAANAVCQLTELRNLSMWGTKLTDDSLAKLSSLKWLETLGLTGVAISDKGLEHLARLKRLRQLWLTKSDKISDDQVERLKKALPGLNINW